MPDPFADIRTRLAAITPIHMNWPNSGAEIFIKYEDSTAGRFEPSEVDFIAHAPADLDWCVKRIEALEAALCPFTADVRDYYYSDDSPPRCQFCHALLPTHTNSCRTLTARRALD